MFRLRPDFAKISRMPIFRANYGVNLSIRIETMTSLIRRVFYRDHPRNYLVQDPIKGALLAFAITLTFMLLYRPLEINDRKLWGFEGAMVVYSGLAYLSCLTVIALLKHLPTFADDAR